MAVLSSRVLLGERKFMDKEFKNAANLTLVVKTKNKISEKPDEIV